MERYCDPRNYFNTKEKLTTKHSYLLTVYPKRQIINWFLGLILRFGSRLRCVLSLFYHILIRPVYGSHPFTPPMSNITLNYLIGWHVLSSRFKNGIWSSRGYTLSARPRAYTHWKGKHISLFWLLCQLYATNIKRTVAFYGPNYRLFSCDKIIQKLGNKKMKF